MPFILYYLAYNHSLKKRNQIQRHGKQQRQQRLMEMITPRQPSMYFQKYER